MNKKMLFILLFSALFLLLGYYYILPAIRYVKVFEKLADEQGFDDGEQLRIDSIQLWQLGSGKDTVVRLQGIRLLNFWASWCVPCLAEMKSFQALQDSIPGISIDLLSFDAGDTAAQRRALEGRQIRLPAFYIRDSSVFHVPLAFPRTVVLRNNTVIRDIKGSRDWMSDDIRHMIDTLVRPPGH